LPGAGVIPDAHLLTGCWVDEYFAGRLRDAAVCRLPTSAIPILAEEGDHDPRDYDYQDH
jgi:hypothetical protein